MNAAIGKGAIGNSVAKRALNEMPANVLLCNPKTFVITYANKTSIDTLNDLRDLLPPGVDGGTIVGQNIDVFHKTPSYQRSLLSDPKNLPHSAVIRLGEHMLDLNITGLTGRAGAISDLMLNWSVVTDRERLDKMVNNMPLNVMMCDPRTFTINFANDTSIKTLRTLEHLLPIKAEEIVGSSIDIFHKVPSHQQNILKDPKNLPHNAKIQLGDEWLDLNVAAIMDGDHYLGAMLNWSIVTDQVKLAETVREISTSVASSSSQMQETATGLSAAATESSEQTTTVASATEQVSANVQTVAAAAEELSRTIDDVAAQVKNSADRADEAVKVVEDTNAVIGGLNEAASKIGEVVNLINDIAEQTNLLALNATIEAARAGDAGKGFAVVASEVKSLASQTANATEEIGSQISNVQKVTSQAVEAMKSIEESIKEVSDISGTIATAVEEQQAATQEIANNVQQAASGASEVSGNIGALQEAAESTGVSANEMLEAANTMSEQAAQLNKEIDQSS